MTKSGFCATTYYSHTQRTKPVGRVAVTVKLRLAGRGIGSEPPEVRGSTKGIYTSIPEELLTSIKLQRLLMLSFCNATP